MITFGIGPDIWTPSLLIGALVGALLAMPIFRVLLALKSRQTVSQYVPEHAAKQGTPTMGGLILAVGFFGGMAALFTVGRGGIGTDAMQRYYIATVALFLLFGIIGFVDDFVVPRLMKGKRGLGWTQKLIMQIVSALVFVAVLGRPMPPLEIAAGVFLILFFSNAYNFSDGLDALAGSLLLAMTVGFGLLASLTNEAGVLPVLASLAGGALPFLWLNRPPARIFMGDVGALPVGAVFGAVVSSLLLPYWSVGATELSDAPGRFFPGLGASWPQFLGTLIVSFMMIAELVPVPLQILSVKLRGKRIFPATPIHHSFQRAGWKEIRVVALFVGVQLACSLLGPLVAVGLGANPNDRPRTVDRKVVFRYTESKPGAGTEPAATRAPRVGRDGL